MARAGARLVNVRGRSRHRAPRPAPRPVSWGPSAAGRWAGEMGLGRHPPKEGPRHVTTTKAAPATGVGFRSERGPVLAALMLSTGLVALDSTIIATAVPSVVSDLGGFSQFPWLFSIYLLTQAVTV